jgi:chromosome segregation and condensation protein ScpB
VSLVTIFSLASRRDVFWPMLHGSIVASFSICRYKEPRVETPLENSKPHGQALEELIGAQALSADLKTALLACLTWAESRRWTVGELVGRLNNLGVHCSKPAVLGALGELELEISLCPFLPWSLVEHGTEWSLAPKSALIELLSGVRKLPEISSDTLADEHKAVLLVVIGYRHKGGVSKTRIREILGLDAAPFLEDLCKKELVYTAPGKELNWWRPTPEALLALGLRSYSDIPELKELERYFDSTKSFGNYNDREANLEPILEKAKTSQARRRRRELERRSSVPKAGQELGSSGGLGGE